jgi:hypothetical protein
MAGKSIPQDVKLVDENEFANEAYEPGDAPNQAIAAVQAATKTGPAKQAPARKGDKRNSEAKPAAPAENQASGLGEESVDYDAELNALVENEATLSEEFKEKTAILFESAVNAKVASEIDRLEEQYAQTLAEEITTIQESMVDKIDSYLNYVVENWMEENKLAIQNGLRTEIAEDFMNGLKTLFTESYIDIPESKVDLVDELADKVNELEEQLNTTTKDAIELSETVESLLREKIITEATKGLADTQAEKLVTLVGNIEFVNEQTFAKKVKTIKEAHFTSKVTKGNIISESEDGSDNTEVEVSPLMEAYLQAIRRTI